MIHISHASLPEIISNRVRSDPQFRIFTNTIDEIVSVFQFVFVDLIKKWHHIYPNEYLDSSASMTEEQIESFENIIREIQKDACADAGAASHLSFPFIRPAFVDILRLCKKNMSSSLYYDTLMNSLEPARKNPVKHFPNSDKIAVIVDPRYDELMEAVIRNFMHFLNPCGWNLMIFSAATHKERILADFPSCLFAEIGENLLIRDASGNTTANMSIHSYNQIMLSKEFWQSIPATHIAIFQKDCFMYKMFDEDLFLSYHYAGANFSIVYGAAPFHGGMNGGFSLRNRDTMIECIESVSWEMIVEYNTHIWPLLAHMRRNPNIGYHSHIGNEDVFFANACEILGKCMPDFAIRNYLAIDDLKPPSYLKPAVYHGWTKNYHDLETAKTLLRDCKAYT